jgi:predicted acylesterase/phospholipase RssA
VRAARQVCSAASTRLAHRLAAALALLLAALCPSCIGVAVGTAIDTATDWVSYPVNEYVCQGAYKYDNPDGTQWRPLVDPSARGHGEELVGMAVSGGGSRAAYFFATVMHELSRVNARRRDGTCASTSLLDEIDYLSGASGGALGAAYYVLERPAGSDPSELDPFFHRFRGAMRTDFETQSLVRTLLRFYWVPLLLTYYHRGHLMAGVFDERLFAGRTFADLPPPAAPYPELLINATSYSSGQKFLFSRLPAAYVDHSILFAHLRALRLSYQGYFEGHQPLSNRGFDTIDSDLALHRVSLAVVASAAVPNLLGPMVLRDHTSDEEFYEVLGDGGIYDNYGLETLLQVFAARMEADPGLPGRILIVDGSGFFVEERERRRYTDAGYADRTYSIGAQRTASYAEAVCEYMRTYVPPGFSESPYRNLRVEVLSLYHAGQSLPDGLEGSRGLPSADLVARNPDVVVRFLADFNREVRGIGTRFRLGAREAALVKAQGRRVVREVLAGG